MTSHATHLTKFSVDNFGMKPEACQLQPGPSSWIRAARPIMVFGFYAGVSEFELDRKLPGAPGASRAMALGPIRVFGLTWEFGSFG